MSGQGRWKAALGWLGALGGLAGTAPSPAAAQATAQATTPGEYRPATAAPAAWQAFSTMLRGRFEAQFAADDVVQMVEKALAQQGKPGGAADTVTVRAWILPSGEVSRVEFNDVDPALAVQLRALLSGVNAGGPPPADMLQPVHLRLALRPKEHAQGAPTSQPTQGEARPRPGQGRQ